MYLSVLLLRPRHRPRHRAHTFEIVLGNVLSYFQVLVNFLSNAMDLLKALPTAIITDRVLTNFNLTEVSELRAINRTMKEIITLNRQHIFTVCFHVRPHGLVQVLNEAGRIIQISTFKEGIKHGEENYFVRTGTTQPHLTQTYLGTTQTEG
jgi:hypothetical protein